MVLDTFWPSSIPVIPSFGNNDVYPHNQIGGPDTDGDLLSFYEQMWRPWIPKDQRNTFLQGGYYITQVAPRLNVLSLNTMYFYVKNKSVKNCQNMDSPAFKQLVWFEEQLRNARSKQDKIYVIGHVPPSPRDYKGTCLNEYKRIAANYTDVVMGQFFAHLNMDHFLMFDGRQDNHTAAQFDLVDEYKNTLDPENQHIMDISDYDSDHDVHVTRNTKAYLNWLREMYQDIEPLDDKRAPPNSQIPLVVVQVSPSVLPVYNPAIRIYKYEINPDDIDDDDDDDNEDDDDEDDDDDELKPHGTLLNYAQYFANLTKWNTIQDQKLEYEIEYSTDEAYGMEDLTVESYFEFAKAMVEDTKEGRKLWATYRHHMLVKTEDYKIDTVY